MYQEVNDKWKYNYCIATYKFQQSYSKIAPLLENEICIVQIGNSYHGCYGKFNQEQSHKTSS
jgi:hypothetical protein